MTHVTISTSAPGVPRWHRRGEGSCDCLESNISLRLSRTMTPVDLSMMTDKSGEMMVTQPQRPKLSWIQERRRYQNAMAQRRRRQYASIDCLLVLSDKAQVRSKRRGTFQIILSHPEISAPSCQTNLPQPPAMTCH